MKEQLILVWTVEFRAVIMSGMLSLIEKAIQHPFVVYTLEGFISSQKELLNLLVQRDRSNQQMFCPLHILLRGNSGFVISHANRSGMKDHFEIVFDI